ncbi:hypothetical protein JKP88DRAFT_300284 [Tribonema minus]|uniref:TFIIS N-terminal domain-containing protein n=1 Tax=Tribonema minus TaxID=303371 RepID=A0A835ZEN8_9STRA|nr:hypothetical protein JKP88DRAFT_300284 [Tribonema minus]
MMAHGCGTSPDQNAQRQQQQQQQQQHQQCSEEEQDARGGGSGDGGDSALPSRRGSADSGMDGSSANGEASVSAADDASDGAAISGSTAASAATGTSDEEQARRKRRRVRSADAAIALSLAACEAPSENCEGGTGASTASAGARTAESTPTPAGSSGFRPQSPHLPGPGGGLSLGMRVATHTAHGQWAGGWRTLARKKAVLRGLDKIFSMAQSEDNFTLFGNDIIQCFYDVASATGEPVRARALMYVEQLAQRWKTTVRHAGWRQSPRSASHSVAAAREPCCTTRVEGDTATAPEIIDAIVAMYCLERVGIHDDVKVEVEAALDAYTAKDYLGWNPLAGPPPERVLDVYTGAPITLWRAMSNMTRDVRSDVYTGAPITPWRAMSNSLISTFYAHRVGVRLGCGYEDVFRWLRALRPYRGPRELKWQEYMDQLRALRPYRGPRELKWQEYMDQLKWQEYMDQDVLCWLRALRPYRGPRELRWQEYMDQCYLVAHVILTLNSWGELRLEPELLPHEYLFVREHLAVQITQRDVHLVGQFIEVLRVFGAADSDPLIQAGITFLLQAQEEDGSWDRGEDRDDYTTYHATMVGIQFAERCYEAALLVHVYRGSGPGITSLAPLLEEWYAEEMCRESKPLSSTAAVDEANDTSPTSSDSESRSPRKRALCKEQKAIKAVRSMAQDIGRRAKMQDWQGVEALLLELEGRSDVGCSVLQATSIGKTVKKLRAVADLGVAEAARRLVERWRELVSAMLSHPP